MFHLITSNQEFQLSLEENKAVMFYFSHDQCNVCKVLKPRIKELITNHFPEMKLYYCDTVKYPELAAQNQIFAVPAILIFFEKREYIRKSRNLGIEELKNEISRPYGMIF